MTTARRTLIAVGALVMGYAVIGALADDDVRPIGVLLFLAGVLAGHDAVLLPLAIGGGALIGRFVPVAIRPAVRLAALASLAVAVVGLPLALGLGRVADNPSVLPLPYGRGLALTIGAIWTTVAVRIVWCRLRRSRRPARPIDGGR